jgi:hypothetical protein
MRLIVGLLTCFCAYTVSQAFADEPPAQASSEVQPAQASPAAAPSAATPASSASSAQTASASKPAASADATDDATDKRLRSQGYKPEVRNGTRIYCRKETEMGSRFPSKVCATAEQLAAANKDSQDALNKVQLQAAPVKAN